MKQEIKEQIKKVAERGLSPYVIEQMLVELYYGEVIRFDNAGNPYWNQSGESIDPDVELVWKD